MQPECVKALSNVIHTDITCILVFFFASLEMALITNKLSLIFHLFLDPTLQYVRLASIHLLKDHMLGTHYIPKENVASTLRLVYEAIKSDSRNGDVHHLVKNDLKILGINITET